jgi:hypothetical protein
MVIALSDADWSGLDRTDPSVYIALLNGEEVKRFRR